MLIFVIRVSSFMANVGFISLNISNAIVALVILAVYLLDIVKKNEIRTTEILVTIVIGTIIIINQSPNMVSILLIFILYILYKDTKWSYTLLKFYFYTGLILFIIILFLYFFVDFNSKYNMYMWRINDVIYRQSLGFTHPNFAMMTYLSVFIPLLGLINKRYFRLKIVIIFIISMVLFQLTQSRTSAYVIAMVCVTLLILGKKSFKQINQLTYYFSTILPILLFVLSLIVLYIPENQTLNILFSGRQALYKTFYHSVDGLHWLASPELEDAMFDNGFLHALLAKGGLFASMVLIIYTWLIRQYRQIDYIQAISIVCFFMIAFTETTLFKFELFFPLILLLNRKKRII